MTRTYEQIQRLQQTLEVKTHLIGQKDAIMAEKEQKHRQSREEIQRQNQQLLQ